MKLYFPNGSPANGVKITGFNRDAWTESATDCYGTTTFDGSHTWKHIDTGLNGDKYDFYCRYIDLNGIFSLLNNEFILVLNFCCPNSLEAKILTDIGNQFQIRHFETDKIKLNEEDVDYLYYRLFNLILRLLAGTGRLLSS